MKTSNGTFKVIGFAVLASVVGAGLGVLFAPQKGRKTRKRIRNGAKDITENIVEKIRDEAHDLYTKIEELEDKAVEGIKDIIKSVKHKANSLMQY